MKRAAKVGVGFLSVFVALVVMRTVDYWYKRDACIGLYSKAIEVFPARKRLFGKTLGSHHEVCNFYKS